jgi:hypothetical protein
MRSPATWTARIAASGTPEEMLDLLTEPEAIARCGALASSMGSLDASSGPPAMDFGAFGGHIRCRPARGGSPL